VTDGNANAGSDMGDAALLASELNASISFIQLEPVKDDYSVTIDGPSKVLSYSDAQFSVTVTSLNGFSQSPPVSILVDGEKISPAKDTTEGNTRTLTFTESFPDGQHKIEASVSVADLFPQNNQYYMTVKSVPKPKILFVSRKISPLEQVFQKLYDMDKVQSLPDNLDSYYAVVINDMPASAL
jgi:hypothetical protein